ncbi:hypothetical protein Tco_0448169 [Tanacetum coccineum]
MGAFFREGASVARADKKDSLKVAGFDLKSAHCRASLSPEILNDLSKDSEIPGVTYMQSWDKSNYARETIELRANVKLKDTIVVAMPKLVGRGTSVLKNIGSDVTKNLKKPSGNKKKDMESRKEVSNPNPFDVLNSVENDVDLGTNGGTSNLASKEANSSGSSFWNVGSSSTTTTPIVEKHDKLKRLIIDGKFTLVDGEGKSLKKVDYSGDHDSEDEVEPVDNEMENFLASKRVGYGTNILLE